MTKICDWYRDGICDCFCDGLDVNCENYSGGLCLEADNEEEIKSDFKGREHGRYDIVDGKYYPSWVFSYNGKDFVCIDKKHAFEMAEIRL